MVKTDCRGALTRLPFGRRSRSIAVVLLGTCLVVAGGRSGSAQGQSLAGANLYDQAIARLLAQPRLQISETLHYGVAAQPQRYHIRVRFLAPDRLRQARNDRPSVSIQVGRILCAGPRRWHCHHTAAGPNIRKVIGELLLPGVTHLRFRAQRSTIARGARHERVTVLTIRGRGDPWQCPPFAVTCPILGFDEQRFQAHARYRGVMTIDARTGLPQALTSSVLIAFSGHVPRPMHVSTAQRITFAYHTHFTITLPHYPRWTCPWWDPPGTWCMKQPGA